MHNIILVGTFHSETGKCNADELYKIIEQINPDVVFEELTPNLYDILYNKGIYDESAPSEFKCIRKYQQHYNFKNIPVDIEVNSSFSNDINLSFALFEKHTIFNEIVSELKKKIELEGFDFLNSDEFSDLVEKQRTIERKILEVEVINNSKLKNIYKTFFEEQNYRENVMLDNIYAYSEANNYDQAVFFIGSAHRNSLLRKVKEYQLKEKIKLNWTFYGKT
jgi:pheromone shutdown protein TraB